MYPLKEQNKHYLINKLLFGHLWMQVNYVKIFPIKVKYSHNYCKYIEILKHASFST